MTEQDALFGETVGRREWCVDCREAHEPEMHRDLRAREHAAEARRLETLAARFAAFHRENPHVYELLVRFARELKAAGYDHAGIGLIWERMRWEMALLTNDPDGFKLNNDYRSRYARLIMEGEPDLEGFFRTRRLTAI